MSEFLQVKLMTAYGPASHAAAQIQKCMQPEADTHPAGQNQWACEMVRMQEAPNGTYHGNAWADIVQCGAETTRPLIALHIQPTIATHPQ